MVAPDQRRAPFIVFEGGEGSGKTTQASLLADRLRIDDGREVRLTREPGGTVIGSSLREILLNPVNAGLSPRAEALLMAADRAQHAAELIRPSLDEGIAVISDRYLYSSVAYQGYGRGSDPEEIRDISLWATESLLPDLVILIDVDRETANRRLQRELDRFELAGEAFHERVRAGFLEQAASDPARWVTVDGRGGVDEIAGEVRVAVAEVFARYS